MADIVGNTPAGGTQCIGRAAGGLFGTLAASPCGTLPLVAFGFAANAGCFSSAAGAGGG